MNLRAYSLYIILVLLLGVQSVIARESLQLFIYQEDSDSPRFILPRRNSETPKAALERYIERFLSESQLKSVFESYGSEQELAEFKRQLHSLPERAQYFQFDESSFISNVNIALHSNCLSDMSMGLNDIPLISLERDSKYRMFRNLKLFKSLGSRTHAFAIPLNSDIHLNETEKIIYQNFIATKMDILIALGGRDLSHELYASTRTPEDIANTVESNAFSDFSEYRLVEAFKNLGRGIFIGICRGHQLGGLIDGHRLNTNILPNETNADIKHRATDQKGYVWHNLEIIDNLLSQFLTRSEVFRLYMQKNQGQLRVNSFHHMAVLYNSFGNSFPLALADDQVIEALIGKNLKSFTFQFHLEHPATISGDEFFSALGRRIFRRIVAYAILLKRQAIQAPMCVQVLDTVN